MSECTCPGTAGMGSNVSCRHWVSTALGGLPVTLRAGVKVDQQPDGFTFPHSFSLFSHCGRHPRASQILKRDGISGEFVVTFAKREMWTLEPYESREGLKHISKICNDIFKKSKRIMIFFNNLFHLGQRCHTYPPLKIKIGQGSQSCGHTNRLSCFLRHRLCCSCLLGGRSWITLFFSLLFDPTPCKQAMLNGKENISGKWFQYSWNCLPCVSNLLAQEQGLILERKSLGCEYIWINEWKTTI